MNTGDTPNYAFSEQEWLLLIRACALLHEIYMSLQKTSPKRFPKKFARCSVIVSHARTIKIAFATCIRKTIRNKLVT